jgi:GMP synthase-like glutamine amidotransferase
MRHHKAIIQEAEGAIVVETVAVEVTVEAMVAEVATVEVTVVKAAKVAEEAVEATQEAVMAAEAQMAALPTEAVVAAPTEEVQADNRV